MGMSSPAYESGPFLLPEYHGCVRWRGQRDHVYFSVANLSFAPDSPMICCLCGSSVDLNFITNKINNVLDASHVYITNRLQSFRPISLTP